MALIGEMKYLTIGGNTYSIPEPELPIASSSTLGGIKVGSGLTIDSSTGVLTATGTSITIDTVMSDSSTNTVQNKVIKSYVDTNIPTKVSDLQNDSGFTTNTGTVTSVRVQASSPLSSSTSTAQSTSLNTTISFSNQNKNLVLAGPSSGSSAAPSFRSLVAADIPDLSSIYLTSFTETDPVFSASAAAGITATDITNWDNKVSDTGKWNDVELNKSSSAGYSGYVPFLSTTNATIANLRAMSDSPSSGRIAVYNSGNYLISTTPGASDSSTKVATTAWVAGKGYLTSYTETDPTVPSWAKASTKPSYTASEVGAVATSAVGAASGVAPLNASSKIDSTYLPSYVDDIIEGYYYNSKFWKEAAHTTEITGEAGKIYVDLSTNKTYRYSGTGYVEVSSGSLVTITRNLTSGTKSATINIDGIDYDIYSVTNTDTKVKTSAYTPDGSIQCPIFGGTSSTAEEKYVSLSYFFYENNGEVGIQLGSTYGNSSTGFIALGKGSYATTLFANSSLSANRTIYLPNADGTVALTSDISDTKVTQTPLNTSGGYQGLLFSKGDGASTITDTVYTSKVLQWNEYVSIPKLTLFNGTSQARYLTLKYNSITIGNSSNANQGVMQTAALTSTRTYTLPDATGTIALTSDIPSIPTNVSAFTNDAGYITSSDENVTINGVLDVTPRRCHATLSSAGWYRVLKCQPNIAYYYSGIIIKFYISVYGSQSSAHEISLAVTRNDGARFYGEHSANFQEYVEAIRATSDETNLFVDIKWNRAVERDVTIYFEAFPDIGWQSYITAQSLQDVAASPSGETVLTEYAFHANGAGDVTYNGNVTVGGVLDVTQRRCEATLSSAGWYRVLKTVDAPGEVFKFEICRTGSSSDNETHTIDYHMDYGGKNCFVNETSVSGNLYIDKIRCNYDSSYAYIDIHYNTTTSCKVYVHFSAEGVRNVNLNTVSIGLSNVGTSPGGETVLAEYSFTADTNDIEDCAKDSNFSSSVFQITAYRRGDMLSFYWNINVPALAAETEVTMGTFSRLIVSSGRNVTCAGQKDAHYLIQFKLSGAVTIYSTNATTSQFVRGSLTMPADL